MPDQRVELINQTDNTKEYFLLSERRFEMTIPVAAFTDGGGTTGTFVLPHTIPAGALFESCMVKNIVNFLGDTTAVITVGDGTDVDRYNTGTPNVFVTAAAGVDMGVPSGTKWHTIAIATITVTVTGGSDFTSIVTDANGSVDVIIIYNV